MADTGKQYDEVINMCRELYVLKMKDYGPSWRIEQARTITDQIFINAKRIRTIMLNGEARVDDDIYSEFVGIVNYGVIGLIQLEYGFSDTVDMSRDRALELYDHYIGATKSLMMNKNADYGEAWRDMRVSSYVDFILTKVQRTKSIEDNEGKTLVSEGIAANYQDMINYAVFALIRHNEGTE
ncbi:MAG: DUF1599 domain-containing protein [Muribaculaceae bacterium]|nr:DUF1599 domain-containing protein [Muribaculaceae bacterium]